MQPKSRPADGLAERILHLTVSTVIESQAGQEAALRAFCAPKQYARVDWWRTYQEQGLAAMEKAILKAAKSIKPTLVWMQVQAPNVVTVPLLKKLRKVCAKNALLVNWTGDVVDYEAILQGESTRIAEHLQPWMIAFAQELDLFTASNMNYTQELADCKLPCSTGFAQCGYDPTQFAPRDICNLPGAGFAVLTAHRYPTMEQDSREALTRAIGAAFPTRLHVYGAGWNPSDKASVIPPGINGHAAISFIETSQLYTHARVNISTSCSNNMRRYTSGRLQRILACGGFCAVHTFPDMDGLGLKNNVNCVTWTTERDLVILLATWLLPTMDTQRKEIQSAALALAREHMDWNASMAEMMYMVRQERMRRITK